MFRTNDIYSFKKELRENDYNLDKTFNSVAIISRINKISPSEAAIKVFELIYKYEEEFESIRDIVINGNSFSVDVKAFIKSLEALIGGNAYLSSTLKSRYQ